MDLWNLFVLAMRAFMVVFDLVSALDGVLEQERRKERRIDGWMDAGVQPPSEPDAVRFLKCFFFFCF
jgi:hypothetical protein